MEVERRVECCSRDEEKSRGPRSFVSGIVYLLHRRRRVTVCVRCIMQPIFFFHPPRRRPRDAPSRCVLASRMTTAEKLHLSSCDLNMHLKRQLFALTFVPTQTFRIESSTNPISYSPGGPRPSSTPLILRDLGRRRHEYKWQNSFHSLGQPHITATSRHGARATTFRCRCSPTKRISATITLWHGALERCWRCCPCGVTHSHHAHCGHRARSWVPAGH